MRAVDVRRRAVMLTLALASLALGPVIYAAAAPSAPAAVPPSLTGTITKVDLAHHVVVLKVTKGAARYKGTAVTINVKASPPGATTVTRLGHAGKLIGLKKNDRVVVIYKLNAAKKPFAVHVTDSGPAPVIKPSSTPSPTPSATDTTTVPYSPPPTGSTSTSPTDPNTIHLSNFHYTPNVLTVSAGTTVHIVVDGGIHTWTSGTYPTATTGAGAFDSNDASTYSFTFNTPGDYPFFCKHHGGSPYYMTGTVHVTAS